MYITICCSLKQIVSWNVYNEPVLFFQHNDANIMKSMLQYASEWRQLKNMCILTIGQKSNKVNVTSIPCGVCFAFCFGEL